MKCYNLFYDGARFVFDNSITFKLDDKKKLELVRTNLDYAEVIIYSCSENKYSISKALEFFSLVEYSKDDFDIIIDLRGVSDEYIMKNFNSLKELEGRTNCKFMYSYNSYPTATIDEVYSAILFIEEKAEMIRKYNLSPMESLLFIYDMVRDRVYIRENVDEWLDESRNLSRIINSSKIVCDGYANLFNAISRKVGIYTEKLCWKSSEFGKPGHASNLCYVNDTIYNIHGVFGVDATFGRNKGSNNFLKSYSSFGVSLFMFELFYNQRAKLVFDEKTARNNVFKKIILQNKNYEDCFDFGGFLLNMATNNLLEKILYFQRLLGLDTSYALEIKGLLDSGVDKNIINDKLDDLYGDVLALINFFRIHERDFAKMVYRVRCVESSIDKEKYALSYDDLYRIVASNSFKGVSRQQFDLMVDENNLFDVNVDKIVSENLDVMRNNLLTTLKKVRKKQENK